MSAGDGRRLDQSLPPDLPQGGFARLIAYWRWPAFTWPWFQRRGLVFWPIALVMGSSFGAWHASSMATWDEFWPLAWRAMAADLVVVSAGPLMGSLVRQMRIPHRVERLLVLAAVIVGVLLAYVAAKWSVDYHEFLMGHDHSSSSPEGSWSLNRVLAVVLGQAPDWIVLAVLGGGIELVSYFSERRRLDAHAQSLELAATRRERDEADIKLSVLQAQIEPHFLFNTLASVRFLVRTDPEQAAQTIDALSNYLRTTLPKLRDEAGASTLGEQADIAQGYLELMSIRMGGRLSFELQVPEMMRRMAFPPLILLTLVENAVKHGIEPKTGAGRIIVRARVYGADLVVEVEDDGAGLSTSGSKGLGLSNIRAQLKSRFGERASFSLAGEPGKGALAMVSVPAS